MPRIKRNGPCPCGSGRKYKHCCLRKDHQDQEALRAVVARREAKVRAFLKERSASKSIWKLRKKID